MTQVSELNKQLTGHDGNARRVNTRSTKELFTQDEIAELYAPFPLAAHSIREGYKNKKKTHVRWFVYLDRIAIQRRLDELFVGEWSFMPVDSMINRQPTYVNIYATLTIRGVARTFNGGQSLNYENEAATEDLEKGAMTDTFRRVASVWGLGSYLYDSVEIWTPSYNNWDEKDQREAEAKRIFRDWYVKMFGETPSLESSVAPTPPTPATKPDSKPEPEALEVKYNLKSVIDRTEFMYGHRNHAGNSIDGMIKRGEITPDDNDTSAAWKVFEHRAASETYKMDMPKVYQALTVAMEADGSAVPVGSIKQWVTEGKTMEQAWEAVVAYHENANLEPAKPTKAETAETPPPATENDVPF